MIVICDSTPPSSGSLLLLRVALVVPPLPYHLIPVSVVPSVVEVCHLCCLGCFLSLPMRKVTEGCVELCYYECLSVDLVTMHV